LQQIREQRLMQLREDNGQYGNYSGQKSACTKFHRYVTINALMFID